jgi:acyl-CoA hydrolase
MIPLKTKTPRESQVETRYIVMPQHANDYGIAFGGTIMAWIDMVAAMVAQKHCEGEAVTVRTDQISFLAPVRIGDHVVLRASANYVGNTSMEVGVKVMRENPYTGECVHATTAYLTFVGLDRDKHPTPVPRLKPESVEEIRRHDNARLRVESRKELIAKLRTRGQSRPS